MLFCPASAAASKPLTLSIRGAVFGIAIMVVTPSARRGARDRAKILLVGLPGIARMHVGIDETGNDLPLRRVDYLRAAYRPIRLDRDHGRDS
jgi:hypothetical protein